MKRERPYKLRCGLGDFNYLSHDLTNDSYTYAGGTYESPGVNTCIHTKEEWAALFPLPFAIGKLEKVRGPEARKWRENRKRNKKLY